MSLLSVFKKERDSLIPRRKSHGAATGSSSGLLNNNVVRQLIIELKEPHRIWKPDEYVVGEAILVLKKDTTNLALRLGMVSEIRVKTSGSTTVKKSRGERLFERSTLLYGEDYSEDQDKDKGKITNGLTKGEHRFPFRMKVRSGRKVFSSLEFERGSIRHYLQCQVENMGPKQEEKPVSCCEQAFFVIVPVDVATLPKQKTRRVVLQSASTVRQVPKGLGDGSSSFLTRTTNKSSNSNSSSGSNSELNAVDKTVTISVNISHSGYSIGEIIPINVSVQHYKSFCHPAGLIVTLSRICRVGSGGKDEPMETFRKDICQSVSPLYVDPTTFHSNSTVYLKVPIDAFSTFTSLSKYFTFQYYVEVVVNLSQKNIVFTESNRAIGVPSDTALSSSEPGKTNIEGNINQIQRKFLNMVGNDASVADDNDIESNIFYRDMVNVQKLKRQNNVTGMSVETIIGTTRSQSKCQTIEVEQTAQVINELPESPLTPITPSAKSVINDWLMPAYADVNYPPVPQYTPNSEVHIIEDKKELEHSRLKQLESDPPTDY